MRGLVARGLSGVRLASSDAHPGLVDAIAATLPGAAWQRCRTHFMRNLLTRGLKGVAADLGGSRAPRDHASLAGISSRVVASVRCRVLT